MKFKKFKKKDMEVEEFDITSLLDILVILLVFLLKSFNDSDLTVDLVNELALPYSLSRTTAHDGVVLQVNKKGNVFINSEVLGNIEAEETVEKIKRMLKSEHARLGASDSSSGSSQESKRRLINFVFDKGLKYAIINKIMVVCAETGFAKYKLIIQGEE